MPNEILACPASAMEDEGVDAAAATDGEQLGLTATGAETSGAEGMGRDDGGGLPVVAQPVVAQPVVAQPVVAQPVVAQPVAVSRRGPLLALLVVALALVQIGFCVAGLPSALRGVVDFKAFYTAGHLLREGRGHDLFNYAVQQQAQIARFGPGSRILPFLYPSYAALLFVPFALVGYRVAYLLFLALNLACLGWAGTWLLRGSAALERWPKLLRLGLLAAFFPVSIALMQGQISILLLLLYVGFGRLLEQRRHFAAGLLLALGLVKFQLAIPVALLFLGWRFYRVIAGFVLGAAGLGLVSLAVCGWQGVVEYGRSTTRMAGSTLLAPAAAKLRYGMFAGDMPNLHGLFFTLAGGRMLGVVLAAAASVAVMVWAWRQRPSIAVALPVAMLVSYHMEPYDLVLLLLPLALVIRGLAAVGEVVAARPSADVSDGRMGSLRRIRGLLICCGVLLTAPLAPLLLVKSLCSVYALGIFCVLLAGRELELIGALGREAGGREAGGREAAGRGAGYESAAAPASATA